MKYMFPALSNWMPSWDTRGTTLRWTISAPALLRAFTGPTIAGSGEWILEFEEPAIGARAAGERGAPGFLGSDERAPGCPVAGVECDCSAGRWAIPDRVGLAGLDVCRCTPDWPVSKTVNRKRPLCGPVSFTVSMSQAPLFGTPAASCSWRPAMERCWKTGLPNVIGVASLAVGPAEAARGVKSEKRMPSAMAASEASVAPVISRAPTAAHFSGRGRFFKCWTPE